MAKHFTDLGMFKSRVGNSEFKPSDPDGSDRTLSMMIVLHFADISNPTKPWNICQKWTELVFLEFFSQGDHERALQMPISMLMDRETVNIAKSQQGFIDFIILPSYNALTQMLPEAQTNLRNVEANKEKWATLIGEYERRMMNRNRADDEEEGNNLRMTTTHEGTLQASKEFH